MTAREALDIYLAELDRAYDENVMPDPEAAMAKVLEAVESEAESALRELVEADTYSDKAFRAAMDKACAILSPKGSQ